MSARSSEYRDATVAKCLSPCTKMSRLELLGVHTPSLQSMTIKTGSGHDWTPKTRAIRVRVGLLIRYFGSGMVEHRPSSAFYRGVRQKWLLARFDNTSVTIGSLGR
jgi:hypothetical protein